MERHKGSHLSEETKRKISSSLKGRYFSEETREKLREARKNYKVSDETRNKISDTLKGHVPWNKGLTKDIDDRVAENGRKTGITNTGRTKENDESVARRAAKMRGRTKENHPGVAAMATKLRGRKSGTSWNRGLTKETDDRLAKSGKKISVSHTGVKTGISWNKGKTKENDSSVASTASKLRGRTKETDLSVASRALKLKGRTAENHVGVARRAEKMTGRTKENDKAVALRAEKMIGRFVGDKSSSWQGGKSFEPYTVEFNKRLKERIRQRDNNTCQKCSKAWDGQKPKFHIHHIDYDKKHSMDDNLLTLCNSCNSGVNTDRWFWTNYFQRMMQLRFQCIVIDQINQIQDKQEVCV